MQKKWLTNEVISRKEKVISADYIQEVVAKYFNIAQKDLKSSKRSNDIAYPRQIAMFLCRDLANMPFSSANIARTVGQAAANYNAAYTNLIFAGVNNTIAKLAFTGLYAGAQFGLKQLIGYGINQIWWG